MASERSKSKHGSLSVAKRTGKGSEWKRENWQFHDVQNCTDLRFRNSWWLLQENALSWSYKIWWGDWSWLADDPSDFEVSWSTVKVTMALNTNKLFRPKTRERFGLESEDLVWNSSNLNKVNNLEIHATQLICFH